MSILRFLGLSDGRDTVESDTDTVRRIAGQLDRLEPEKARYLAAFAYVLARLANADLHIDDTEEEEMRQIAKRIAHLSEAEAALVVEIAKTQAKTLGGTQDYVVTRQFREISTREQRGELLQCLYAVAAADGTISSEESAEIAKIGEELGFTRPESSSLRSRYRDKLAEFQNKDD